MPGGIRPHWAWLQRDGNSRHMERCRTTSSSSTTYSSTTSNSSTTSSCTTSSSSSMTAVPLYQGSAVRVVVSCEVVRAGQQQQQLLLTCSSSNLSRAFSASRTSASSSASPIARRRRTSPDDPADQRRGGGARLAKGFPLSTGCFTLLPEQTSSNTPRYTPTRHYSTRQHTTATPGSKAFSFPLSQSHGGGLSRVPFRGARHSVRGVDGAMACHPEEGWS